MNESFVARGESGTRTNRSRRYYKLTAAASLASSRSDTPRNDGTSCDATKADWMRAAAATQKSWSFIFCRVFFGNLPQRSFYDDEKAEAEAVVEPPDPRPRALSLGLLG